jgi:hypothetical protein
VQTQQWFICIQPLPDFPLVGVVAGGGKSQEVNPFVGQGQAEQAAAVGGDAACAQVMLPFTVAAGVGSRAVIKVQGKGRVGVAVERALNDGCAVGIRLSEGDDGIVLQVVAAGIGVAIVVDIDAVGQRRSMPNCELVKMRLPRMVLLRPVLLTRTPL